MSTAHVNAAERSIALPADLQRRLHAFRGLVWRVKTIEAVCGALFGFLLGYLLVFGLDRLTETPQWLRLGVWAAAVAACAVVPLAVHRWIWNHRLPDQVARLIARRFPSMGDQILGIIEIVREFSDGAATGEAGRSRALCEAAVGQVADQSRRYDFAEAVPHARHRLWMALAAVPVVAVALAAVLVPDAAANAWARFLTPWKALERYTFTRVGRLPAELVVPHGEAADLVVGLADDTRRRPPAASARIGRQQPLAAALEENRYAFTLPPQLEPAPLALAVGDARERTRVIPMFRPEITAVRAEVKLPAYLKRPAVLEQDVRGGMLAPVKGSTVTLMATASRELAAATVDGTDVVPQEALVRTTPLVAAEERKVAIEWRDRHGLAGPRPLVVAVVPRNDEPPAVSTLDMPASRDILLSSDTLRFKVAVRDDFGIRRVGIEWEGADGDAGVAADKGDRLLQQGGPEAEALEVAATFCPDALGIRPQPLVLRAFAEDYLPGRGRSYSAPQLIYVVDRAEHALIMNELLNRWRGQATELRDRELGLLKENVDIRSLPTEQLTSDETRRRIERQAAAEEAQSRKMERLVDEGAALAQQAMKNPEFDPQTLEKLAEDIQTLAEIGESRMPSVAELLRQAANAKLATARPGKPGTEQLAGEPGRPGEGKPGEGKAGEGKPGEGKSGEGKSGEGKPGKDKPGDPSRAGDDTQPPEGSSPEGDSGKDLSHSAPKEGGKPGEDGGKSGPQAPKVGEDRTEQGGEGSGKGGEPPPVPTPQIVDKESSQQPKDPNEQPKSGGSGGPSPPGRLGLPTTQAGVVPPQPGGDDAPPADDPPADEALADAIAAQQKLLEEFNKVAEDLAKVMANLEGSTFVKRLKLASRQQATIAERLAALSAPAFGAADQKPAKEKKAIADVADVNVREVEKVSNIMDDMQAYFDRRQLPAFRTVLEELKGLDVLGGLRQLSDDLAKEPGMSLAQSEFWSDTFDRLADDLVPPPEAGGSGSGGGGQQRPSLPPEVILEAMQILEAEVNLREETRVGQQTRKALTDEEHAALGKKLGGQQDALADRVVRLVDRLLEEDDGEQVFGPEIQLFDKVEEVMAEAADLLRTPDTGPKSIAAETEVIELLLQSQAAGGRGDGGGGSGASPGGGGTGTTSALAEVLAGRGNRTKGGGENVEKGQGTGVSGRVLPDEFRAGLDAYFNQFEKERR